MITYQLTYIVIINIFAFLIFGIDKYFAITNRYRISENTLLFLAIVGGSIGAIIGQKLFRHKTQKFKWVLWIILFIQITLAIFLIHRSFNGINFEVF